MSLDAATLSGALLDDLGQLGVFDQINKHEPKSAPGRGLTTSFWINEFAPIQASGLAVTSMRLTYDQRIYLPMVQEPQDEIDDQILDATIAVMGAYSDQFTLRDPAGNQLIRCVDLLGMYSDGGLTAKAGYINQDSRIYRAMVLTIPLIIDDVFEQGA